MSSTEKLSKSIPDIHSILTLKIQRNAAGRQYPFDKIYIFREDTAETAPKLTPNNAVFLIKGDLKERLASLFLSKVRVKSLGRHESTHATKVVPSGLARQLKELKDSPTGAPHPLLDSFTEFITDPDYAGLPWYQLVPILGKFKGSSLRPAYLCNPRWGNSSRTNPYPRAAAYNKIRAVVAVGISLNETVPDSGVLTIDGEPYTPPCLCCTRLMQHMSGGCEIGGRICLENMDFGDSSYFLEGVRLAERLKNSSLENILDWIAENERKEEDD
tara:strand:- start:5116 stop:5931 length:816 start_codon:yes stop_codon:yes gene_type:complete